MACVSKVTLIYKQVEPTYSLLAIFHSFIANNSELLNVICYLCNSQDYYESNLKDCTFTDISVVRKMNRLELPLVFHFRVCYPQQFYLVNVYKFHL